MRGVSHCGDSPLPYPPPQASRKRERERTLLVATLTPLHAGLREASAFSNSERTRAVSPDFTTAGSR
jgi:hypothetical protein